jgi:hypothetical protein
LSALLAPRCQQLIAADVIPDAVARARDRMDGEAHVDVRLADFPTEWPEGTGDLLVLSEVAYYLTDAGLPVAEEHIERWLEPDGHLLAVHYTGTTDYPRTGAAVAEWLDAQSWLDRLVTVDDPAFELAVWCKVPTST